VENLEKIAARLAQGSKERTEATIQADVRSLLLEAPLFLETDDVEDVFLESPVAGKRIDVEVGLTAIEVKRSLTSTKVKSAATEQLAGYVRQRTDETSQRYVGILTDGSRWVLLHLLPDGSLGQVSSFDLNSPSEIEGLVVWLENVLATVPAISPTPEEIVRRLGADSPATKIDLADLRAIYEECRDVPEVVLKRALWAKLLTSTLGSRFPDSDELFVLHTYLVVTAELIAHTVLGIPTAGEKPEALLSGQVFRRAELRGVVDADFFDWPARFASGERFVSALARRLGRFDWTNVEHDILKALYQSIIDAKTRKKLGEYYTPDWLAEGIVNTVVEKPLEQRVLDPACGSGTFLFWAARRYLAAAEEAGMTNSETIQGLVHAVAGIDLHPVAVALARVTYLLAIGSDRLRSNRPPFSVPVYLGDSLTWEQDETLFAKGGITIPTSDNRGGKDADLHFPDGVVSDANRFDQLIADLSEKASERTRGASPPSLDATFRRYKVAPVDKPAVSVAFASLCRLHDEGRNHIWGYYVRNLARPFFFRRKKNKVQILLGNPPWLSYRFMPDAMQQRYKELAKERGLWSGGKVATHQDLADLFVVRAIEHYLDKDGRFAFVMPAATLSRGAYGGFRSGYFDAQGSLTEVRFSSPWDLRAVRPPIFPMPACVVFGKRSGGALPMPEETTAYSGAVAERGTRWVDALGNLERTKKIVTPGSTDAPVSPYADQFREGATIVPSVLLRVEQLSAGPLGAPNGQIRIRSLRSSLENEPWKSLDSMEDLVEADFVRPAYFGSGVAPFRALATVDTVVPWRDGSLMGGEDPRLDDSPGLARWWRAAERVWEEHKTDRTKLSLLGRLNYQKGLEKQYPQAPHRVLYTKSGNHVAACRLSASSAVIDHTLYWAAVDSVEEAHYLTAVFNSGPLHVLIEPLMSEGLFGKRHIDKYIFQTPIPTFDSDLDLHVELSTLGSRAETHGAAVEIDPSWNFQKIRKLIRATLDDQGIATEIDQAVERLFGFGPSRRDTTAAARAGDLLGALSAAEQKARRDTGKRRRRSTKKADELPADKRLVLRGGRTKT
jgi:SAM-dependent methyltransferase